MAARIVLFFVFISNVLPIFFCHAHLISSDLNGNHHLEGSHKGETLNGLNQIKSYLTQLGYLTYHEDTNIHAEDNYFDDQLESAIKTYQQYYRLNPSGILDKDTTKAMAEPRCGVPDFTPSSSLHNQYYHFNASSHYAFFPGSPRWPAGKTHLTYAFGRTNTLPVEFLRKPFYYAFQTWARWTNYFTFEEILDPFYADLRIVVGPTHNGIRFDGQFFAFADAPVSGWSYFDASQNWALDMSPNGFHLQTIAQHEIGHLLGLGHSRTEEAIMFPVIHKGTVKVPKDDDIRGIHVLYNY